MRKEISIETLNSAITIAQEDKGDWWDVVEITLPEAGKVECAGIFRDVSLFELSSEYGSERQRLTIPTEVLIELISVAQKYAEDEDSWFMPRDEQVRDRLREALNPTVKAAPKKK